MGKMSKSQQRFFKFFLFTYKCLDAKSNLRRCCYCLVFLPSLVLRGFIAPALGLPVISDQLPVSVSQAQQQMFSLISSHLLCLEGAEQRGSVPPVWSLAQLVMHHFFCIYVLFAHSQTCRVVCLIFQEVTAVNTLQERLVNMCFACFCSSDKPFLDCHLLPS